MAADAAPAPPRAARRPHACWSWAQLIAGPFCAKILGEFGADGDQDRAAGPRRPAAQVALPRGRHVAVVARAVAQQALGRARPAAARGAGDRAAAGRRGRHRRRELPARARSRAGAWATTRSPPPIRGWSWSAISGYGQTGPYRERPGFGVIGEAMGGLRHVTGTPDRPPSRVGVSIGDTLSALYGVIGALIALQSRRAHRPRPGRRRRALRSGVLGDGVDCCRSSTPSAWCASAPARSCPGIAPTSAYRCSDGSYVLIAANADSIFRRLCGAMEPRRPRAPTPSLAHNEGRARAAGLARRRDRGVDARRGPSADVLAAMEAAEVPASQIYSIADIVADPHYAAREMIRSIALPGGDTLKVPGVVPRLSRDARRLRRRRPARWASTPTRCCANWATIRRRSPRCASAASQVELQPGGERHDERKPTVAGTFVRRRSGAGAGRAAAQ